MYRFKLHNIKLYKHGIYSFRKNKVRLNSCKNDSIVYPEYFQLYSESICAAKHDSMNTIESIDGVNSIYGDVSIVEECIKHMYVPPPERQIELIDSMKEIANNVNISSAEGAIFKLLLREDNDSLEILLELIKQYYSSLDSIRIIIKHISMLPSYPS